MAAVRRQRGAAAAKEADQPRLRPEAAYLWIIWNELHAARGSGGMAPNPISWTEIEAFSRVADEPLEPWEARAVRAVDNAYMAALAGQVEGGDG